MTCKTSLSDAFGMKVAPVQSCTSPDGTLIGTSRQDGATTISLRRILAALLGSWSAQRKPLSSSKRCRSCISAALTYSSQAFTVSDFRLAPLATAPYVITLNASAKAILDRLVTELT